MEVQIFRAVTPALWRLYEGSFPYCERRGLERHLAALDSEEFLPYVIRDDKGEIIGLMYVWHWGDMFFVEHLATVPEVRGRGIGSWAIRELQSQVDKEGGVLVLEIDPPVTDIAKRRKNFYERDGFVANTYKHIHPSFREPLEPHELVVMSYPREITVEEFNKFQSLNFKNI